MFKFKTLSLFYQIFFKQKFNESVNVSLLYSSLKEVGSWFIRKRFMGEFKRINLSLHQNKNEDDEKKSKH